MGAWLVWYLVWAVLLLGAPIVAIVLAGKVGLSDGPLIAVAMVGAIWAGLKLAGRMLP